jgi:Rieske Fe-S protein
VLQFARQGQFHPLQYVAGLARAVLRRGGRIHPETHATEMRGGKGAHVRTEAGHTISTAAIVVATNTPVNDIVAIHTKQTAYVSYVIAGRVPDGLVPLGLYWDTEDPYHYLRLQPTAHGDVLIVGGEDHRVGRFEGSPEERWEALETWTRTRIPGFGPLVARWSGQVMHALDGLAFIGRNPLDASNVFVATGDCGTGMTHGTIAGMLLSDLVVGVSNVWAQVFDPARSPLRAPLEYLRHNVETFTGWAAWLTPGDVSSVEELPRGQGAIVRSGLTKIAAYRDEDGTLHRRSAVCQHLGCVVAWNTAEKTWDCPCHGSRFDARGHVLQGPANRDLAPVD